MTTHQRERLREARLVAGLSQRALSEATGIHYVSIARYETGANRPDVDHALALARALSTTVERLFGDDALALNKQGGPMTYQAERRLQITLLDGSRPAGAIHEDRGDGTPVCNIALRPLEGQEAKFNELGQGEVTCGRCARVHGDYGSDPVKVPGLGGAKALASPTDQRNLADRVEKREAAETDQGLRLYGTKEASEALGVTTNNIDKVAGLPAPVTEVAATRLWRADEIDAFALERHSRRAGNGLG